MRKMALLGILGFVLIISGCIEYDEDLVFNEDGSGTVKVKYSVSEQLAAMMGMSEQNDKEKGEMPLEKDKVEALFKDNECFELSDLKVEVSEGRRIVSFNLKFKDYKELEKTEFFAWKEGFTFKKNEDGTFLYERKSEKMGEMTGQTPAEEEKKEEGKEEGEKTDAEKAAEEAAKKMEEASKEMARAMMKGMTAQFGLPKIVFKVTLPKEIAETNADSHEGKTANWKFEYKFDESDDKMKQEMTAKTK